MKTKVHRSVFLCMASCLWLFNILPSSVFAQGTAFTYQGSLNVCSNAATGNYDLTFTLYDARSGGNVLAGPVTNTAVPVTNGFFITCVDFGVGVFTGSSNWLGIGVCSNRVGAFTTLSPLQRVAPTPYAIFAEGGNASGLSGTIPGADLNGTYGGTVIFSNAGNSFSGDGGGLTGLNAAQLVTGTASASRLPGDVAYTDASQTFTGANIFNALELANGDVRLGGNRVLLYSGGDTNNGLGSGNPGLPGIFSGAGPFLFGDDGGALGVVAPNTVCLSWDNSGNVWVSNDLSTATLTIRGGADLAEPFNITSQGTMVPQGAVVVIDKSNPGRLKLSDHAYDPHVAGVISGANGIRPGIQMHQQGLLEGGQDVALNGRVYVQAETSNGAIQPGDLLTTSSFPGYAMKVTDHARAAGAILGKAMTGLSEGKGMVLVLVTLQ